jgi:hypothetical protein
VGAVEHNLSLAHGPIQIRPRKAFQTFDEREGEAHLVPSFPQGTPEPLGSDPKKHDAILAMMHHLREWWPSQ